MRSCENSKKSFPSYNISLAGPFRCPPLINTYLAPMAWITRAASRMSSSVLIAFFERTCASGMFGVTTRAIGMRRLARVSLASSTSNVSPPFATITGSTTNFLMPWAESLSATTSIAGVLKSIPVFAASAPISERTASSCSPMNAGGKAWMALTSFVFCAVMAVSTLMPKPPRSVIVFRSA